MTDDRETTAPTPGEAPVSLQIYYPSGTSFDADYYRSTHAPMAVELLAGHGLRSVEGSRVESLTGQPFGYQFVSRQVWESEQAFRSAFDAGLLVPLRNDAPNFFDGHATPVLGIPIVHHESA